MKINYRNLFEKRKFVLSIFLILLVFTLRIFPSKIPYFDEKGNEYFETAIKKALVAYGTVRVLNAAVSIAKETEVEVSPLGVGLTVHVGQLLDPIDDATERLSFILTVSIAVLGSMRIIEELLQIYTFKFISYFILFLFPGLWIKKFQRFSKLFLSIIAIVLAIRLALPICGVINNFLYKDYFEPRINKALSALKSIEKYEKKLSPENFSVDSIDVDDLEDYQKEGNKNSNGIWSWSSIKNKINHSNPLSKFNSLKRAVFLALNTTKGKIQQFKEFLFFLWQRRGELVESLSKLIVLEVSMITIQVIVLPLTVAWVLIKLANTVFEEELTLEGVLNVINKGKHWRENDS